MIKTEKVHYCDFCGARVESKFIAIRNKHVVCTFAIITDKDEKGTSAGYLLDICQKCASALDEQVLAVRRIEHIEQEKQDDDTLSGSSETE